MPAASPFPDEDYWERVKAEFLFQPDQIPLNAANMCPTPRAVLIKPPCQVPGRAEVVAGVPIGTAKASQVDEAIAHGLLL